MQKAILLLACVSSQALAQTADQNVLEEADDAFGASLGRESFGLYSANNVRGFSPIEAGNSRLLGFYFNEQGALNPQLVLNSNIRIGLAAIGFPLPAPTGIVDYRLRLADTDYRASVLGGMSENFGVFAQIDGDLPLADNFGVALSAGYFKEQGASSNDGQRIKLGLSARWKPTDNLELIGFGSHENLDSDEVASRLIPRSGLPPRRVPRLRFFGPDWAVESGTASNFGAIVKFSPSKRFSIEGGIFNSRFAKPVNHPIQVRDIDEEGFGNWTVNSDPEPSGRSTSGELRIRRTFVEGKRLHEISLIGRGVSIDSRYGGGQRVNLGRFAIDEKINVPRPNFTFGPQTIDNAVQLGTGVAYYGRWGRWLELSAGVQQVWYTKEITPPGEMTQKRRDTPILPSVLLGLNASDRVAFYAGFTRGLEESGLAPSEALNRNEALPARETEQVEMGVRLILPADFRLVLGAFRVEKPFFGFDDDGSFRDRGQVRHQGFETSLTGKPAEGLRILAGGTFLDATVSGPEVTAGRLGPRAVGQARFTGRFGVDWRPNGTSPISLDVSVNMSSPRMATRDNETTIPSLAIVNLGTRVRFPSVAKGAAIRFQVVNVADTYGWRFRNDGAYTPIPPRSLVLTLGSDF